MENCTITNGFCQVFFVLGCSRHKIRLVGAEILTKRLTKIAKKCRVNSEN